VVPFASQYLAPPLTAAGCAPTDRPLRADARRNRDRILCAARELFASNGRDAQMEDIAGRAAVGVGTVYRHFPTKTALLTAMVIERFAEMAEIAREVEADCPGGEALTAAIRRQTQAVQPDKGFQLAMMGWDALDWDAIEPQIAALGAVMQRLIARATAEGLVRPDLTFDDIGMLMCGVTSTMYFKPAHDWRRYLEIVINGLRPAPEGRGPGVNDL
jgi:AcrR family transcriptional regulator